MYRHLPLPNKLSHSCLEPMASKRKCSVRSPEKKLDAITVIIRQGTLQWVVAHCFGVSRLTVSKICFIIIMLAYNAIQQSFMFYVKHYHEYG